jgi:hypothetical protein
MKSKMIAGLVVALCVTGMTEVYGSSGSVREPRSSRERERDL